VPKQPSHLIIISLFDKTDAQAEELAVSLFPPVYDPDFPLMGAGLEVLRHNKLKTWIKAHAFTLKKGFEAMELVE
jgi:hypothetical protein